MQFRLKHYGTPPDLELLMEEGELEAPRGRVADYIPELRRADPDQTAVALCYADGTLVSAGHDTVPFTIQSVSKVPALLYALDQVGTKHVFARVGKEPSGDPFNSGLRFQTGSKRPLNPFINAGAIVVTSLFPGTDPADRVGRFLEFLRRVCGNPALAVDEGVYLSEKATGHNNRSLAWVMNDRKVFAYKQDIAPVDFVEGILDAYFRQCAITVTCKDLARIAGLLANLGVLPGTNERVVAEEHASMVLALMGSCGLYDGSGTFAASVGIPAKSGVGGGIIAAAPGKVGIATFGPGLDAAGNSAFGVYALERISKAENLSILSRPREPFRLTRFGEAGALDELVQQVRLEATAGQVATYIPELAKVLPERVGVALCTMDGTVLGGGEFESFRFTIQAMSIPMMLAYILHRRGAQFVFSRVGMEPTGDRFDAAAKWLTIKDRPAPFNPLNNAGAIMIASMMPEETAEERRAGFLAFVQTLCDDPQVGVDQAVFESERSTGERNRQIAWDLLHTVGFDHRPRGSHQTAVEFVESILADYFWACSLTVNCAGLSRFAGFLAAQGNLPDVCSVRMAPEHIGAITTLMSTCGLYEGSGEWAFAVGVPSKTGISGGVLSVVPGRLGLAAVCSAVDGKGTSVAGRAIIEAIARAEHLSLYRVPPAAA